MSLGSLFDRLFTNPSPPTINSLILQGAAYIDVAIQLYNNKLLLAPAMDLSPMHINCARIIFLNTSSMMSAIYQIAQERYVTLRDDDVLTYGTEGQPIYSNAWNKK